MNAGHTVYGLHIEGPAVGDLSRFLLPASDAPLPRIEIRCERQSRHGTRFVDDTAAELDLPDGRWLQLDRASLEAVYSGPGLSSDQFAHPYLGPLAIIFNRWLGREVFHAGSFVADEMAWVVVGQRESGKSSLLAALAERGSSVLADDISVSDGEHIFTGPRCIDLRQPLPDQKLSSVSARDGTRYRLLLPHGRIRCPVGGWLFLRWGYELSMTLVPPSKLLERLARHRLRTHLPSDPAILLPLVNRPAWVLTRPRSWSCVDETISEILAAVATPSRSPSGVGG